MKKCRPVIVKDKSNLLARTVFNKVSKMIDATEFSKLKKLLQNSTYFLKNDERERNALLARQQQELEVYNQAFVLHEQGLNAAEIARKIKRHEDSVRDWLKRGKRSRLLSGEWLTQGGRTRGVIPGFDTDMAVLSAAFLVRVYSEKRSEFEFNSSSQALTKKIAGAIERKTGKPVPVITVGTQHRIGVRAPGLVALLNKNTKNATKIPFHLLETPQLRQAFARAFFECRGGVFRGPKGTPLLVFESKNDQHVYEQMAVLLAEHNAFASADGKGRLVLREADLENTVKAGAVPEKYVQKIAEYAARQERQKMKASATIEEYEEAHQAIMQGKTPAGHDDRTIADWLAGKPPYSVKRYAKIFQLALKHEAPYSLELEGPNKRKGFSLEFKHSITLADGLNKLFANDRQTLQAIQERHPKLMQLMNMRRKFNQATARIRPGQRSRLMANVFKKQARG